MNLRPLRGWLVRLFSVFHRKQREQEFAEELASHLAFHMEDNLRAGMSPEEARRQALIKLGGVALTQERYREQRGLPMLETLIQDLRFGLRMLHKNPGFSLVAILTLALGIGANTAIFSVVNAVLLKPLPYPEPGQLAQLRIVRSGKPDTVIGSTAFVQVKAQSQSLARIAAYSGGDMTLTGAGAAEGVVAGAVTADFFPLLGVLPALGRNFTQEEDTPNGPKAAILGHGLWQSRFGGDLNVLGRTVTLNEQSYTVVGILPARFQYPEPFQLWIPLALSETSAALAGYGEGMVLLKAIARLKPSVTLEQAQTEMQTIAQRIQPGGPTVTPGGNPRSRGEGGGRGRLRPAERGVVRRQDLVIALQIRRRVGAQVLAVRDHRDGRHVVAGIGDRRRGQAEIILPQAQLRFLQHPLHHRVRRPIHRRADSPLRVVPHPRHDPPDPRIKGGAGGDLRLPRRKKPRRLLLQHRRR